MNANPEDSKSQTRKRSIAREWLVFLALLILGVFLVGPIFYHGYYFPRNYYEALSSSRHRFGALLVALVPYGLYLLARSVVWSAKMLLPKQKETQEKTGDS